ncbi:hypothetical protein BON67_26215 [Escherichia coli]|uniref:Uncharacterized protein n=13 Tax=Enterobacteriaceae TaxID=543 RepID=A0A066SSH2_ECOLX|nr:hypothetical protein EcSMS35_2154 [Escherichia coli SMS-3-5]AIL39888.1 hypothetical protein SFyv_1363 [Shigella flexneri Shi06HN006]AIT34185.1 hypothetical protein LI75_07795 [Escherichia coli FAP1]AIX62822.1 hypothetical protein ECONIH1_06085 [Escherichia coli]AIZ93782.1 hypothetical protein EO53_13350 [Escherichia coli str. K-12 substr. MG1655]AKD60522.1 hypothetical protein SH05_08720 [Escherichia coli K-12]AKE87617.1 hypothetical protein AAF13_13715 [Escherichia coli O104:H4 str. C227-
MDVKMPAISVSFIISSRLFNKVYDKADMPTMQLIRMNESKSGKYVYMLVSMIKEKF